MFRRTALLVTITCIGSWFWSVSADEGEAELSAAAGSIDKLPDLPDLPDLHHLFRFGPDVINGSAPEGDEAFASLRKLGIKTIISVEAAAPDVERAKTAGIRYVHLPIGYDKVPAEQGRKIAKAVRDLPGPVYIHCYHGVHRSPAAAAYIMVLRRQCSAEQAIAGMKLAKVGEKYPGLYASVQAAAPVTDKELDAVPDDFPAIAETEGLEDAMSKIGRHWDNLKLFAGNDFKPLTDHPDLAIERETEIMADLLEYLARSRSLREEHDAQFNGYLDDAYTASLSLKKIFNEQAADGPAAQYQKLATSCKDCHRAYRD